MNEEQSFWTLSVIIQNFLPEGMYDVTMEGANIDQAVLMTLIMERLPTIWSKFSGGATSVEMDDGPGLPTVTLVTSHWFLTLFINILPVEVRCSLSWNAIFSLTFIANQIYATYVSLRLNTDLCFLYHNSRFCGYGIVSFTRDARSCSG
jgi:hypothetical protein